MTTQGITVLYALSQLQNRMAAILASADYAAALADTDASPFIAAQGTTLAATFQGVAALTPVAVNTAAPAPTFAPVSAFPGTPTAAAAAAVTK